MLNLSRDPSDRPPRNAGRHHLDDCQYTADEIQFMLAVQRWRERHRGAHPSCRDVLAVAKALGYRQGVSPWRSYRRRPSASSSAS